MSRKKLVSDIRSSSYDERYAGVVFHGTLEMAQIQAAKAPEYPASYLSAREELLKFLRLDGRPLSGKKNPKYGAGVP